MGRRKEGFISIRSLSTHIRAGESTVYRALRQEDLEIDPPLEMDGKLVSVNEIPRIEGIVNEYKKKQNIKGSASNKGDSMV